MLKRKIRNRQLLLWVGDAAAILVAVQIAIPLATDQKVFLAHGFKSIAVGSCFFLTLLFYITDLYNPRRDQRSQETASLVVLDVAIAMAFVTLGFYFDPRWSISRSLLLIVFLVTPGLVMAERLLWSRLYGALSRPSVVGVLGDGLAFKELRQVASEHKLKVVPLPTPERGSLPDRQGKAAGTSGNGTAAFHEALNQLCPDIVVIGPSVALDAAATQLLIDARFSGITVLDLPTMFQLLSGKLPLEHLDPEWFASCPWFPVF